MKLTLQSLPDYCVEEGDCWLWQQATNGHGYPIARVPRDDGPSIRVSVRRYVLGHLCGKRLTSPMWVVTSCGSRLCVRPEHLMAATKGSIIRKTYADGRRGGASEYAARQAAVVRWGGTKLTLETAR